MYIARILYPVKVLGPGNRVGIWFDGCEHHCKGCSNPELWEFQETYLTELEVIEKLIYAIRKEHKIDGFTLTGGDPFLQPDALRKLLPVLNSITTDIICYTGYSHDELKVKYDDILSEMAVLIDGRYIEERNTGIVLRGSDNQNVIILNESFAEKYRDYLSTARNEIQNFRTKDTIISVGIHDRDYMGEIDAFAKAQGFVQTK